MIKTTLGYKKHSPQKKESDRKKAFKFMFLIIQRKKGIQIMSSKVMNNKRVTLFNVLFIILNLLLEKIMMIWLLSMEENACKTRHHHKISEFFVECT